ncbi:MULTISPECIES: ABC transporter permease [unclassified Fusibacter]|uniref:ABC transporter permease n=1 Tax=unclassified Fusibacter TaxID=2624464 RepID=UPI0019D7012E|nr:MULTISPECIES: ABC transporter permease [unclassified Fusibacter]MCK8060223.1 ABC transporter permease [Fusibacter sp. A2]
MKGYYRYFSKKIMWYALTLIIAVVINFMLPRLISGNPVDQIVARITKGMTDSDVIKKTYETFYAEFNLDKSLPQQFFIYVKDFLRGDFGTSFTQYPRPVKELIANAVPWTVAVQLPAIILGWLVGWLVIFLVRSQPIKKVFMTRLFFPQPYL